MGCECFTKLQDAIVAAGFKNVNGEPDLFCWTPSRHWFFAEARRTDMPGEQQRRWFRVCRDVLGENVDIRVYHLTVRS